MKKIIVILLSFALIFFIIHSCDYRLWMLKSRKMTYDELPDSVKSVLYAAAFKELAYMNIDNDTIISDDLLLGTPSDTSIYYLKSSNLMVAPWIYYSKLIDKKKKLVYRIAVGTPRPLVIFKERLYIPDEYQPWKEKIFTTIYTEYELK